MDTGDTPARLREIAVLRRALTGAAQG